MNKPTSHGFTLVELIVTLAIVAILATIAVPSFQEMMTKNRIKNAAESIFADMQLARLEAIKRNTSISVVFNTNTWCYGLDDLATACDCTAAVSPGNCTIGTGTNAFSKVVNGSTSFNGVSLSSSNIIFDNVRGAASIPTSGGAITTTSPAPITVSIGDYKAGVVVAPTGSVSLCTPYTSTSVKSVGYRAC